MWIHPRQFCLTSYRMKIISIYSIFSQFFLKNKLKTHVQWLSVLLRYETWKIWLNDMFHSKLFNPKRVFHKKIIYYLLFTESAGCLDTWQYLALNMDKLYFRRSTKCPLPSTRVQTTSHQENVSSIRGPRQEIKYWQSQI